MKCFFSRLRCVLPSCLFAFVFFLGVAGSGCNRGAMRLYGAGSSFPPANTNFYAKSKHPENVFVSQPADRTGEFYGRSIAGTSWQATRTDTISEGEMKDLVHRELLREMELSRIFNEVHQEKSIDDLILDTDVRAFGSQVRGFLWMRVGGVASFRFVLRRNDEVLFEKIYERVVRDGDPEYTGKAFGVIEDAMRATMSDSLRGVLKDLFSDLEKLNLAAR